MKTITIEEAINKGYKFGVTEDGDFMIKLEQLKRDTTTLDFHTLYVEQPETSKFSIPAKAIKQCLEGYLECQDEVNDEDGRLYDQLGKVDFDKVASIVNEHFTTTYYYPDIDLQLVP